MKPVLFVLALTVCLRATSLHSRLFQDHTQSVNSQCCLSQGGTMCGYIMKDCCKGGCSKGFFSENCNGDKINPSVCDNTCERTCSKKNGILCGSSFSNTFQTPLCCLAADCTATPISASCKNQVNVTGCYSPNLAQRLLGG